MSGELQAQDEASGLIHPKLANLTILEFGPSKQVAWYASEISFGSKIARVRDQASSLNRFAIMLSSGLSTVDAVRILSNTERNFDLKRTFQSALPALESGVNLSKAIDVDTRSFSPIVKTLIAASDEANALPKGLVTVAGFLERTETLRSKLSTAFIYPSILVFAVIMLLLFFSLFLAPNLAPLFTGQGREIPWSLNSLLWINSALLDNPLVSVGVVLLCVLLGAILTRKLVQSRLLRSIPLLGKMLDDFALLAYLRPFSMMISSNFSTQGAAHFAAEQGGSGRYHDTFKRISEGLIQGQSISETLENDDALDEVVKDLIATGDRSNQLPSVVEAACDIVEKRAATQIERLVVVLPITMTLVLGLLIGALVVSVMTAVLDINNVF